MLSNKEKQLLKIIRYAPIGLVLVVSILYTYFLLSQTRLNYENELVTMKEKFINEQRIQVKQEVQRVIDYIRYEKGNSEERLREFIKKKVYIAHDIATSIYKKYRDTKSKEEIIDLIKTALREIRFNDGRGYYYIHTMNGINVLHAIKPSLEGNNIIAMKDKRGVYILQKIIKGLESSNDYFSELYWYRPNDLKNEYRKITFNKRFEPYDMIIGSGEYLVDFENILKERISKYISTIKYGVNGYVFVFDYNGVQLSHIKQSYINQNRIDLKDANGFYITRGIIEKAKTGGGYIKYIGTIKPDTGEPARKTTYVKGLDEFKWALGSGFYADELNSEILLKEQELHKENKDYIIKLIIFSAIFTLFFLAISVYLAKMIEERFLSYRKKVLSQIQHIRETDNILAQQSKMAAMGEMLANIAHQWRQPLSLISTISTGVKMKRKLLKVDDEELYKSMDDIHTSVQHLSQTIDDFSDYFNPNKVKEHFYLEQTFDKMLKLINAPIKKNEIIIVKEYENIQVYNLENELLQVLINIVNNAISQLEKIESHQRLLFIHASCLKNSVVIKVKDNAHGIDEKIMKRIFEPYFTTKHKSRGTGLGLYMCQEIIVKHMHGNIEAKNVAYDYENQQHTGAEFVISFPLEDSSE